MKVLAIVLAVGFITGCATTSGLSPEGEVAYFEAQKVSADKPLFEMECPAAGCVVTSIKVNHPDRKQVSGLQVHSPGTEIAKAILRTVEVTVPWVAVSHVAVQGIRNAVGDTTITNTSNTETTSNVSSVENNSATNTSTTTSGDTFGNDTTVVGNDYNTGRVNSLDDNSRIDNTDNTSSTTNNNPGL